MHRLQRKIWPGAMPGLVLCILSNAAAMQNVSTSITQPTNNFFRGVIIMGVGNSPSSVLLPQEQSRKASQINNIDGNMYPCRWRILQSQVHTVRLPDKRTTCTQNRYFVPYRWGSSIFAPVVSLFPKYILCSVALCSNFLFIFSNLKIERVLAPYIFPFVYLPRAPGPPKANHSREVSTLFSSSQWYTRQRRSDGKTIAFIHGTPDFPLGYQHHSAARGNVPRLNTIHERWLSTTNCATLHQQTNKHAKPHQGASQ